MTIELFGKVLWPVWTAEALLSVAQWTFVSDQAIHSVFFATSVSVLPLVAGVRAVRFSGGLRFAALCGLSVSLASLLFVAVAYLFQPGPWGEPFLGFVIATVLFALAPQALFGLVGGWVVRAKFASST